jgi:hypothetical protein
MRRVGWSLRSCGNGAQAIGAMVEWIAAGEAQLVEALQRNALDLAVAGDDGRRSLGQPHWPDAALL